MGYEASEVQQKTCYDVLEGRGALGTTVCHENCSVRQCVGKQEKIPNFDLNTRTKSGTSLRHSVKSSGTEIWPCTKPSRVPGHL